MSTTLTLLLVILGAICLLVVAMALKVIRQFERGVVLRFGQLTATRTPGLRVIIPFVDVLHRVSLTDRHSTDPIAGNHHP